jgi:hypothetical protein
MEERILAHQTARELTPQEIKDVAGAWSWGSTSTATSSSSTTCVNGVCRTTSDNSRDG